MQEALAATEEVPTRQRPSSLLVLVVSVPTMGRTGRKPCKKWARDGVWAPYRGMWIEGGLMANMLRVVMVPRYLLLGWA